VGFAFPRQIILCSGGSVRLLKERDLHRLFSSFPAGGRGFGLLLLRASIGVVAIFDGVSALAGNGDSTTAWLAGGLAVLSGVSLLMGLFTPVASGLVALGAIGLALYRLPLPAADPFDSKPLTIFVAVVAVAVALLGPGALSVDARLFGRREIIIPRAQRSSNF
jgi:uncharacterized membrane protein YphA (DoxX/SURF4 family)